MNKGKFELTYSGLIHLGGQLNDNVIEFIVHK